LDWLSGTFPVATSLDDALAFLGAAFQFKGQFFEAAWLPMERGAMGYRSGVAHGPIKVFYGGNDDMGVHFVMSGKAVKHFLSSSQIEDEAGLRAWLECAVKAHGVVFSRTDWACDDRSQDEPLLDLDVIRKAVDDGAVVSRFKSVEDRRKRALGRGGARPMKEEPGVLADVLYFGSIMSEMCVCFYDKAKEQIQNAKAQHGKEGAASLDGLRWVRCELRAKKKHAQRLVEKYIEQGIDAVLGVLRDCLDFRQAIGSDSNVTRWERAGWWETFLNKCRRVRVAIDKPERTIERVRAWLLNQVAPMFYAVCEVSSPQAFVHHMLEKGKSGPNARRDFLIASERALSCLTP
jgi:phage replication initiation protein